MLLEEDSDKDAVEEGNGEDMDLKKGQRAAGIAVVVSLLLALGKGVVGFMTGSVALLSDALHSGTDLMVMIASWFGLKIAQRKPDEKFPYGYYKAESLTTLFISFFIIYAALELLMEGYNRLFVMAKISSPLLAMSAALASVFVSLAISKYLSKIGKSINSELLLTNSKERLGDAFSSVVVFVAILISSYQIPYVEGAVAILISLLILKIGLLSVRDSIYALMDVSPSKSVENRIRRILKTIEGVESFSDLKLRKAGPFIFGEVDVKIKKFVDVARAHEVAENIEERIKKSVREINSLTVHVEPFKTEKEKIVIPVKNKKGLNSEVMEHFGRANYFVFVNVDNGKVVSHYIKENPFKTKKVRAGLSAVRYVVKEGIDTLVTNQVGEISFHTLRDNFVDIYKTEGKTVKDVIERYVRGRLKRLKGATREKD